ncbi:hypothetical protein JKG41_14570 [Acidithiobacillus sp. MC2.1]|uniref:hypothetical protein n=1 Tax=Acidithiobacillus sp. MC2.2 TaxID=2801579 RepID=UPI0019CFDE9D|nr:hypothetical protein [Acidithiobacillus sp. MC2.2]MBN6746258.1 hypothetical protein [Acidithiobacillus sp. MC2.2]
MQGVSLGAGGKGDQTQRVSQSTIYAWRKRFSRLGMAADYIERRGEPVRRRATWPAMLVFPSDR